MGTIDLNLLRTFVAVHVAGGFTGAAARLGVPRSTVSRAIAALEEAVGTLLFHRTTRQVSITADGLLLYDRVSPSLASLEASLEELPERPEEAPSGLLRLTTTVDLGTIVVAEAVVRFTARYPAMQVELRLSNQVLDLEREKIDLALRVSPARVRNSSLIMRKVGVVSLQLYASPSYLARRGAPRSLAELPQHDWVGLRGAPPMKGAPQLAPRILCDDMFFARQVLRAGAGIGILPSFIAGEDLTSGALARVLPRWGTQTGRVMLVHPSRRHVPRRVTAFRDLLLEMLDRTALA